MVEKIYYSMGEVTEMFDVEASLIRYWCSQFSCLRPKRNAKNNTTTYSAENRYAKCFELIFYLDERRKTKDERERFSTTFVFL